MFIEEILHNTAEDRTAKEQSLEAWIIVLKTMLLFIFCSVRVQSQVGLQKQYVQQAGFNKGVCYRSRTFVVLHYKPLKWGKHKLIWNKFSSRLSFYMKHWKKQKANSMGINEEETEESRKDVFPFREGSI